MIDPVFYLSGMFKETYFSTSTEQHQLLKQCHYLQFAVWQKPKKVKEHLPAIAFND